MARLRKAAFNSASSTRSSDSGRKGVKGKGNGFNASQAHVRLNQIICSAADKAGISGVLLVYAERGHEMNLVNLSTTLHRLAKLAKEQGQVGSTKADPRFAALHLQVKQQLNNAAQQSDDALAPLARSLSSIAWACARLELLDQDMMQTIAGLAGGLFDSFKSFELASLLWGFAKLRMESEALFHGACNYILGSCTDLSTRSASMIAWSFATVRFRPAKALLCRVSDLFAKSLCEPNETCPVVLVNLVWALATSGVRARQELLVTIGDVIVPMLRRFKAYEISITLWAFARLGVRHVNLFSKAAELLIASPALRNEIHAQGIANIFWAVAKHVDQCHGTPPAFVARLLAELQPTCERLLGHLNPVEFSSLLWGISRLAWRSGCHPAADAIMVAAAEGIGSSRAFLERLSFHGVMTVLSAYATFFFGQPHAPSGCRTLIARLTHLCHTVENKAQMSNDSAAIEAWLGAIANGQDVADITHIMHISQPNCEDAEQEPKLDAWAKERAIESQTRSLSQQAPAVHFGEEVCSALVQTYPDYMAAWASRHQPGFSLGDMYTQHTSQRSAAVEPAKLECTTSMRREIEAAGLGKPSVGWKLCIGSPDAPAYIYPKEAIWQNPSTASTRSCTSSAQSIEGIRSPPPSPLREYAQFGGSALQAPLQSRSIASTASASSLDQTLIDDNKSPPLSVMHEFTEFDGSTLQVTFQVEWTVHHDALMVKLEVCNGEEVHDSAEIFLEGASSVGQMYAADFKSVEQASHVRLAMWAGATRLGDVVTVPFENDTSVFGNLDSVA